MSKHMPKDKVLMITGKCDHCKTAVLYESANCRLVMTDRGKVWELLNGYSQHKAKQEYIAWLNGQEKKK